MKCVFLTVVLGVLLLQPAVYGTGTKNITLSIDLHQKNPADVSYVDGKAPEELKAGPAKNISQAKETIAQAAFIRSSNREIPKDDEIENEEFERFIQKYHSRPTIETVFVSTSPSPPAEDSEELAVESKTTEPQAEVFKQPSAKLQAFERSIAHPSLTSHILPPQEHQQAYSIINHQPHDAAIHHGGAASFSGGDGYVFQTNGGAGAGTDGFILQSGGAGGGGIGGGQFVITSDGQIAGGGGDQQYFQFGNFVPATFNVAQNAVKTRTYEIRRPAIQKHYYDIEERVIVRPAGSVIVELDRPVAKVPTGETVVAVGGLTGSLAGNGFQQSSQGGFNIANLFGLNGGGSQQGSGITYASSVGLPSPGGSPTPGGFQFPQGSAGGTQVGIGIQQQQGVIGGPQGGLGIQQSQGGITFSTTTPSPNGSPTSTTVVVGTQQQQGAIGGSGIQQSQSGISVTTTPAPSFTATSSTSGGAGAGTLFGGGGFAGVGIQQSQSGLGISQGGISSTGIQQSQGGVSISTTGAPAPGTGPTSSTTNIYLGGGGGGANGGLAGGSFSQTQGGSGSFGGGGSAGGFQQSQGGAVYSTTGVPFFPSSTPSPSGGGFSGVGFQSGSGSFAGGSSAGGFQQSQGGAVYSTTGVPFFQSTTPSPSGGGFSGVGFQSGSGSFAGGSSAGGFQQSQGGAVYSTTGTPFFQSTTPSPNGGGFSGVGFQQSQGGIGVSQGGGFSGAGFQQSQGGIYSTTPAAYLPPPAPTPTVLIGGSNGGFSGAGFQQSQGGIGLGQGGSKGGFAGFQQSQGGIGLDGGFAGFQQSQGGIGLGQGGSLGGGEIIYSTTGSPSYSITSGSRSIVLRPKSGGSYPVVSTTTGGPIIISANGNNGNGFVIQANSNVQSKGSVSSTTTTERSFSVSRDASAFAKGSSSGGIDPFKITIREPNFSYPPYVEISSNGSPLGHLTQQPYTLASSHDHDYPRMRYQGKLLTGEVRIDDGLGEQHEPQQHGYGALSSHHQNYESQANVAEIPPNTAQEEPSSATVYQIENTNNQHYEEPTAEHQHQFVGSSKQPVQDSQISSGAHQQPNQIYQHHFQRTTSQPIIIPTPTYNNEQHPAQQHVVQQHAAYQQPPQQQSAQQHVVQQHAAYQHPSQQHASQQHAAYQHPPQQQSAQQHAAQHHEAYQHSAQLHSPQQQFAQLNYVHPVSSHQQHVSQQHPQQSVQHYVIQEQKPSKTANYQSSYQHHNNLQPIPTISSHEQHAAQVNNPQPLHQNLVAQIRHQQQSPRQQPQVLAQQQQSEHHQPTESTHSKQQQVTESLEEPVEVSEVHSSTHQQPTLFQQQVSPTVNSLEPYNSGQRQYKQRGAPLKYTQDPNLNVAPTEHTVYFNNNLEHTSARSQNIETPSEPESLIEETSGKNVEASTAPIVTSSTTPSQRIETTTQRPTYASVLAQGKPGILYAPPKPVVSHHSPGRKHHFLRFSSDGSSLFSPFGRQVQLVYSQSPRAVHPHHQSQTRPIPTSPIEPAKQQIPVTNKGYQIQAQLPITRQSQIELNSSSKPAPATEPQITRSQSHAASHQTSARYEAISSTTPETATITTTTTAITTNKDHYKHRGPQKYRNEQTHGAITLRSGRTYGDHRVIASTPAPSDGGAASESVQTRRIVVNHPFQTIQEVVEREPFTNIHQVTVNAPEKLVQHGSGLQEGQAKSAAYRAPAPYKVAALLNHPHATLSFHHGGSH